MFFRLFGCCLPEPEAIVRELVQEELAKQKEQLTFLISEKQQRLEQQTKALIDQQKSLLLGQLQERQDALQKELSSKVQSIGEQVHKVQEEILALLRNTPLGQSPILAKVQAQQEGLRKLFDSLK